MTHPGLAVMLVVGVGLGAVLYYFFANPHEPQQTTRRRNERSSNQTYWAPSSQNNPRNRRPDPRCMICLDDTNKDDAVRLVPCCHVFHKLCIEEWRINGTGEAKQCCPNCRDIIADLEEL